jgi:hypothetical protein
MTVNTINHKGRPRQCAAALIELSRSAIDALPDRRRERLNTALQDTKQEIRTRQEPGECVPALPAHHTRSFHHA